MLTLDILSADEFENNGKVFTRKYGENSQETLVYDESKVGVDYASLDRGQNSSSDTTAFCYELAQKLAVEYTKKEFIFPDISKCNCIDWEDGEYSSLVVIIKNEIGNNCQMILYVTIESAEKYTVHYFEVDGTVYLVNSKPRVPFVTQDSRFVNELPVL